MTDIHQLDIENRFPDHTVVNTTTGDLFVCTVTRDSDSLVLAKSTSGSAAAAILNARTQMEVPLVCAPMITTEQKSGLTGAATGLSVLVDGALEVKTDAGWAVPGGGGGGGPLILDNVQARTGSLRTPPDAAAIAVNGVANNDNGDFTVSVGVDRARCIGLRIVATASDASQLFLYADVARTLEVYKTDVMDFTTARSDRSPFSLLAPDLGYLASKTLYGRITNTGALSDYTIEMVIEAL